MGDAAPETSVYSFLKSPTLVDFPRRLAAIFFVSGCNFRCDFCHNAALLAQRRAGLSFQRLDEACRGFSNDWVEAAVLSGGEPTLAPDLEELLRFFRGRGWAIKLDTNGSRPEVLERVLPLVDYVAMDLKASPERYGELTGWSDFAPLRRSIELLKQSGRAFELRTTVIGSFHDDDQLRRMADEAYGVARWTLQPFVPRDELPDERLRSEPRTPAGRMQAVRELLEGTVDELVVRGA